MTLHNTNSATLPPNTQTFYDSALLMRALEVLAFYKFATPGKAQSLPKNNGNTVSYRRWERLNVSTTPLSVGVTPTADTLTRTEVTVTPQQYGRFATLTDEIEMLDVDPAVTETLDIIGELGGRTVDSVIRATVVTGTNVKYQGNKTARNQLSNSTPISYRDCAEAVTILKANDALPFRGERGENGQGGLFVGIIHPNVMFDLKNDHQVTATFTYSDPVNMYKYTLTECAGIAWIETTLAPVFSGLGSGGANVYGTIVIGKEAYGAPNIAGAGKMRTHVKPRGSAGTADPLDQRSTVGFTSWQAPVILNNDFMIRLETGSTLG